MQSKVLNNLLASLTVACLLALGACGGGGGGSASTSGSSSPPPPTTTTVTGVAAIGAPLVDATLKVVDGAGNPVTLQDAHGNTIPYGTTNVADGSYTLILGTGSPTLPLLIEAVGTDGTGTPVVLHSLLQTITAPIVANITPLTDAVVAEVLGQNPRTVFQNASGNVASIALLGNTTMVTAAATQIKTIIANNLTAAKITTSATLNLFQDATFTTNKTLVDAVLEGLRIQIGKDSSGNDQLQLSNKFIPIGPPEVAINLATAKTQLGLGSAGKLASAIVSSGSTTSSATTTLTNIGVLDNLTIAINKLISQQQTTGSTYASLFSAKPAPLSPAAAAGVATSYIYNGRNTAQLEQILANYAASDYQLSSMQITGCIDDPIPSGGCVNLAVSATVTDPSGNLVDVFSDGITYSKTTTPNWTISGNGRFADIAVYPVAYASFGLNGTLAASATTNPGVGLQVSIQAQDNSGNYPGGIVGNSQVQLPSGQSVPFGYCGDSLLCLSTTSPFLPNATGDLSDTLLQAPTLGWFGNVDAQVGAKFIITYTSWIATTVVGPNILQTTNAYLQASLPINLSLGLFPSVVGVTTGSPLTGATIASGFTLSWATWAAANPNMRVFSVRTVISGTGAPPLITDNVVPLGKVNAIAVKPTVIPAGFAPSNYEVWIGALDNLGHRYYTQLAGPT